VVDVSVIVCTHNPDADLIARAFDGLRQQTLEPSRWELLVIDNASRPALPARLGGILPFNARCILEPTVGLTAARIRGISESAGSLLVFVDDDAVLCPDYLDVAWRISQKYPFVGAFGGSIELEFSSPPADWTRPHWPRLAERSVKKEMWSNFECRSQTTPWGVGMCLQKAVATRYIELTTSDPVRLKLDRSGMSLVSGGDEDMARTSHSLGLATGLFPELNLIHLIPPRRLELDYLLRLVEGQSYSGMVLSHLYQDSVQPRPLSKLRRIFGTLRRRLFMGSRERLFFEARLNGQQRAIQDLSAVH
jgi:glycosyltransferase involved in cell wall biosynthesis